MEYSKYIVPIYVDDDSNDNGFVGNGFIVNGLLIMPYHLIKLNHKDLFNTKVHPYFEYEFEGERIRTETESSVVNQGGYYGELDNLKLAQDLLVFKTDIQDSDLSLTPDYDVKQDCWYCGYNINNKSGKLKMENVRMGNIIHHKTISSVHEQWIELDNCMSCHCKMRNGHSGVPVFQNGKIIGMFIRDVTYVSGNSYSVFIKASYIISAIEKKLERKCLTLDT